jgi:hypothetical protein
MAMHPLAGTHCGHTSHAVKSGAILLRQGYGGQVGTGGTRHLWTEVLAQRREDRQGGMVGYSAPGN